MQVRRLFKNSKILFLVLVIILSLILAGCGKKEKKRISKTDKQEFIGKGAKKEKIIKIGAILPLTGAGAYYGESAHKGIEIALELYKNVDNSLVNRIKVIFTDSKLDPKIAISDYNKLVEIDKVKAIVGPMASSTTLALLCSIGKNDQDILIISPTATSPKLRGFRPYFYRTCVSDEKEAEKMASYLNHIFSKNTVINVLYINNDYGISLAKEFAKLYKYKTNLISYDANRTNFRDLFYKMQKSRGIYVVYLIGYKEQFILLKQLKEFTKIAKVFATTMIQDGKYIKTGLLNGVVYTFRAINKNSKFFIKYKEQYKESPNFFAAASFDAMYATLASLSLYERGKVKKLILAPKLLDIEGATGRIKFDNKNDIMQHLQIRKIVNRKIIIIER